MKSVKGLAVDLHHPHFAADLQQTQHDECGEDGCPKDDQRRSDGQPRGTYGIVNHTPPDKANAG